VNYAPIQEECFRPELSVTLDTEEDYQTILRIVDFLKIDTDEKRRNIDLRVLVAIIDNPDLLTNKEIVRKIPGV
jgi:spore coat polysaccharide biosynthesis protein SpsF (cytidylyltransferase family)